VLNPCVNGLSKAAVSFQTEFYGVRVDDDDGFACLARTVWFVRLDL